MTPQATLIQNNDKNPNNPMHNEQREITQQIVQQRNKIKVVSGGMVFTKFLWQNKVELSIDNICSKKSFQLENNDRVILVNLGKK